MEEEFSRFRWEESGEAALEKLEVKPRLAILDLADESSIDDCVKQVEKEVGRVDILILNGAFAAPKDAPPKDFARMMIKTNNFGCHKALQSFRALLAPGARVLVVASGFGTLEGLPDDLRARLDTSKMSYEELHGLLEEYVVACEEETLELKGWPTFVNKMSKVGQVALTRIFAREAKDLVVNAVCPGWTWTDAARAFIEASEALQAKAKSPKEAAVDAVWAAGMAERPYGELLQYRKVLPWS